MSKWPILDVEEHCIECLSAEDEDSLLLCDKCDSGTHLHCTVPRLQSQHLGGLEGLCTKKKAKTKK
ncbi:hypothetical protein BGZ74_009491 [Mortierella antarctica]|nr:hypothetical protein BGZ74_009491 [Mortierella antarctica]